MARMGHRERTAGQASGEDVAIVLVVGLVLAGAAAVALGAAGGVGERVVAALRTGICIAGGDICREADPGAARGRGFGAAGGAICGEADAEAAGLEPCLTSERGERRGTTMDVAVVRFG